MGSRPRPTNRAGLGLFSLESIVQVFVSDRGLTLRSSWSAENDLRLAAGLVGRILYFNLQVGLHFGVA